MNRRAAIITGAFLTVTAGAVGMEVWFAVDSDPDTLPWTALIADYVPAPIAFIAIAILVAWLPGHFVEAYKVRKKDGMFFDNPNIRRILYLVTIVLAGVVIILKYLPTPWAMTARDAVNELMAYLAGLAGLVAAGNVTNPATTSITTVTPIPSPSVVTTTETTEKPPSDLSS